MRTKISTVFAVLLCSATAAAWADFVVLETDADAFRTGQLLAGDVTVSLGENERIVLLSADGSIVAISGPYEGVPRGRDAQDVDVRNALAHLIDNSDNLHATLGSTRAAPQRPGDPPDERDAWHLDPFSSGNQCVLSGRDVVFWRADDTAALQLVLQRPGKNGDGAIDWPTGASTASWPAAIPLVSGELYVVRRKGWMDNAMIRVVVLDSAISETLQTAIAWLAINGCRSQARILLRQLP
ncbi:MAG TPA: hypothetical protein PKK10_02540 [Woeseiaceae bacterium]|nr:hypothetical protein [Woeseiaceae bacterium]